MRGCGDRVHNVVRDSRATAVTQELIGRARGHFHFYIVELTDGVGCLGSDLLGVDVCVCVDYFQIIFLLCMGGVGFYANILSYFGVKVNKQIIQNSEGASH